MKFTILVDPSLVVISIYISLSETCLSVEKKKRRNFLCSLYDHTPAQQRLPRGNEISNICRLSFGYPYCILSFSDPCFGVEEIFKGMHLKTFLTHIHYLT